MNTKKNLNKKFIPQNYKPEIDSLRVIAVSLITFFYYNYYVFLLDTKVSLSIL